MITYPCELYLKMNVKKYHTKRYTHFDNRIPFDKVMDKIRNPLWVATHGFYPFIHFEIKFKKYNKKKRQVKYKTRKIFYASHIDSYIYKYYGEMLNDYYNQTVCQLGIEKVATAYRTNQLGKSNINFASEIINFIKKQKNAYIFAADFTNYFDTLDHKYLKEKIRYVLKQPVNDTVRCPGYDGSCCPKNDGNIVRNNWH